MILLLVGVGALRFSFQIYFYKFKGKMKLFKNEKSYRKDKRLWERAKDWT